MCYNGSLHFYFFVRIFMDYFLQDYLDTGRCFKHTNYEESTHV